MSETSKCPVVHSAQGTQNSDWWPEQLNLKVLHPNPPAGDPMGPDFDYAKEFATLDLAAVKADLAAREPAPYKALVEQAQAALK